MPLLPSLFKVLSKNPVLRQGPFLTILIISILSNFQSPVFAAQIRKILLEGNHYLQDKEILGVIKSQAGTTFNKELILEDLKNIYKLAYFDRSGLEVKPLENSDGTIDLYFKLKENPPITDIEIYGCQKAEEVKAYEIFSELVGKPENINLLSQKIQILEANYLKEAYILARVKDIDIDSRGKLKIFIDEGLIQKISYSGNSRTKVNYLNHLVSNSKVNSVYNEKAFLKDFKKLQSTGYYSNVSRMLTPSEDSNGYILEITVEEKRNTNIGLGGGINSSAGLFGNVNLQIANVRGQGESLSVSGLLGSGYGANSAFNNTNLFRRGNLTQVTSRYSVPYFMNSENTVSTFASFSLGPNYLVDLSDQTSMQAGLSVSRAIDEFNRISLSSSYNFINLDPADLDAGDRSYIDIISSRIEDEYSMSPAAAKALARKLRKRQLVDGQYFSSKLSYSHSDLDSSSKPRDGWRSRIGIEPNLSFGDINNFTKLEASVSKYSKLPLNSTFVLNARSGFELFGSIPQFTQFRLGGVSGVRGYRQYSDLGLGTKLGIASAELRSPLYNIIPSIKSNKFLNNIDFALFADAGIVGGASGLNSISHRLNRAASVGFGLRVNLPLVGALRVDLGFPLIEALTRNPSFMRFNFGAADQY